MGDLQGKLPSAPDKGEELPRRAWCCPTLGKYTTGLVLHAIGGKMPGGFTISSAKAHLSKAWGLGPQRADAMVLVSVTMEPSKRLGFEAESQVWFDAAAQVYANV